MIGPGLRIEEDLSPRFFQFLDRSCRLARRGSRHCVLLGEKSEFPHSVAAFPPRGAYGPQGSTCPRSESGGVRALRVTASLASPAICLRRSIRPSA